MHLFIHVKMMIFKIHQNVFHICIICIYNSFTCIIYEKSQVNTSTHNIVDTARQIVSVVGQAIDPSEGIIKQGPPDIHQFQVWHPSEWVDHWTNCVLVLKGENLLAVDEVVEMLIQVFLTQIPLFQVYLMRNGAKGWGCIIYIF